MRSLSKVSVHGLLFAMLVLLVCVLHVQWNYDASNRGGHRWVSGTDSDIVDKIFSELSQCKRMDVRPKDIQEFVEQLNTFVPTRLRLSAPSFEFGSKFQTIDTLLPMDQVLLILAKELRFEVTVDEGVLVISDDNPSDEIDMVRIYSLPNVNRSQLEQDISSTIDPDVWLSAGGTGNLALQKNGTGTGCKLLVNAPWRTHRKIEQLIANLAMDFGWKHYEFPSWLTTQGRVVGDEAQTTTAPPTTHQAVISNCWGGGSMADGRMGGGGMGGGGGLRVQPRSR